MDFDFKILLSSLIAASAITSAVSIPFIIFFVGDFQKNKENLLIEIKPLTTKLRSYIEFIYYIYTLDFWKNKSNLKAYRFALEKKDYKQINKLEENDNALKLYNSFYRFQKVYHETYDNYSHIFTFKDIDDFRIKANSIWFYKDRVFMDYHEQFNNDVFTQIDKFKLAQIKKALSKISIEYLTIEEINPSIIAMISGDVEENIINPLQDLTWKYERRLDQIVNKLFLINIITLCFGVILPLTIFIFNCYWVNSFTLILSLVTTSITIISYFLLIFIVNKYIKRFKI